MLAHKPLLAYIMQNTIEAYRGCTVEEIIDLYIDDDIQTGSRPVDPTRTRAPLSFGPRTESASIDEGTIAYDVLLHARLPGREAEPVGLMVNIEAQSQHNPGYPLLKRALYYCARLISDQHGTGHAAAEYAGIEKVYSIWICTGAPADEQDTITEYSVCELPLMGCARRNQDDYDLQTVIMVCLPKDDGSIDYEGFTEALAILFSPTAAYDTKLQVLEGELGPALAGEFEGTVEDMMGNSLTEWVIDMGIREGSQKTTVGHIKNIMDHLSCTDEQAMETLGIPRKHWQFYRDVMAGKRAIVHGDTPRDYDGPEW